MSRRNAGVVILALVSVLLLVGCGGGGAKTALPKGCPPECESAQLFRSKLAKVNLHGANLKGADMGDSDLKGIDVSNADLTGGSVSRSDMTGANLKGANLTRTDMKWTVLRGADLTGATMTGAMVSFAPYDANTKWPEGFDPKAGGAVLTPLK